MITQTVDGYTFFYDEEAYIQETCNSMQCKAKPTIGVRRDAGGEIMHFCYFHTQKYFPKQVSKLNLDDVHDRIFKIAYSLTSKYAEVDNKKKTISTHSIPASDTASRLISQRTDPVYNREEQRVLESEVLQKYCKSCGYNSWLTIRKHTPLQYREPSTAYKLLKKGEK